MTNLVEWFAIIFIGFIVIIIPYFLSLEHIKLENAYCKKKGKKLGEIFGLISGWGFFLFWFGLWISPQAKFVIPFLQDFSIKIPLLDLTIYIGNFLLFFPFFIISAWFGIKGVIKTSLRVAETHRTEKIITYGVYSIVRHPQYFAGIIAHVGF